MVSVVNGFSFEGVNAFAGSLSNSFVGRLFSRVVSHLQQNHSSAVGVVFMTNMATLHVGNTLAEMVGKTIDPEDVDRKEKKFAFEAITIGGTVAVGNFILSKVVPGSMSLSVIAAFSVAAVALRTFFLSSHGSSNREEVKNLKTSLGAKEGEVLKLATDLDEANSKHTSLSEELDTISADLEKLKSILVSKEDEHRIQLESASQNAQELKENLNSTKLSLETQIRTLQENLRASELEKKGLEQLLDGEKEKLQDLLTTEATLRGELEQFQASLNDSKASATAEEFSSPGGDNSEIEKTPSSQKKRRGSFKTLTKALSFRSDKKDTEGT